MSDPTPPRPQPVVDAAKLGALTQAMVIAVLGAVLIIRQGISAQSLPIVGTAVGAAITAVAALAVYLVAVFHAKAAAALVTPLSDPQDQQGRPLVVDPAAINGRHAAPPDDELTVARLLDMLREPATEELPVVPPVPAPTGPQTAVERIPETVIPGKRLGRHVRHDLRSLSYLVPETDTPVTAVWQRVVPVFDQGNLGSCTGNAAAGVLGTVPFYATLPASLVDDETEAVKLYGAATALDDYPGQYPPDDTGSDGLSVAKACQQAGLISGYQHITSVASAQTAIKSGPFIVGSNWYDGMDNPDSRGLVHVTGSVRGGHEYECVGYHADSDVWEFVNSWGPSWGRAGHFFYSSADFARLLSEQGDATVFLPVAPFPQPTPPAPPVPPAPVPPQPPAPPTPGPSGFPLSQWEAFEQHHRSEIKWQALKQAMDTWLAGG